MTPIAPFTIITWNPGTIRENPRLRSAVTTVKYSLEDFTHDMESLLESQPGNQQIFDKEIGFA